MTDFLGRELLYSQHDPWDEEISDRNRFAVLGGECEGIHFFPMCHENHREHYTGGDLLQVLRGNKVVEALTGFTTHISTVPVTKNLHRLQETILDHDRTLLGCSAQGNPYITYGAPQPVVFISGKSSQHDDLADLIARMTSCGVRQHARVTAHTIIKSSEFAEFIDGHEIEDEAEALTGLVHKYFHNLAVVECKVENDPDTDESWAVIEAQVSDVSQMISDYNLVVKDWVQHSTPRVRELLRFTFSII